MELGDGNQCLSDFVQEIQRRTTEGTGMEISSGMLWWTVRGSCGLHFHRYRVEGQDVRACYSECFGRLLFNYYILILAYSFGAGYQSNGLLCAWHYATAQHGKESMLRIFYASSNTTPGFASS